MHVQCMLLKYQSKRENAPHSHNSKFIAIGFRGAADAGTRDCTINRRRGYWCNTITGAIE